MSVLILSPIKFNSKRVKNKNGRMLCHKPLYQYSLDAILEARSYFENTDLGISITERDMSVIYHAYWIAFYVVARDKKLTEDPYQLAEVCIDGLKHLRDCYSKEYETLILVQPSNPFVKAEDIINCYELHKKQERTVRSVSEIKKTVWTGWIEEGLTPVNYRKFIGNGSIVVIDTKLLQKDKTLESLWTVPYIMPQERSCDIDSELDFKIAETIMEEEK